jgi:cell division protein FtsQ
VKQPAPRTAAPPPRRRRPRRIPPGLRRIARWAVPAALAAALYGGFVLDRTPAGHSVLATVETRVITASGTLGLVVTDIEVEGRKTTNAATILAALAADRGTPILAVDPERAQRQLQSLPWVRSATIERRLPGTLFVRLVEREPLAVWQHDGRQELIDRQGEVIPVKDLSRFATLPTVVGANAAGNAAALLDMLAREPALAARVTAAIRVDDRRWNLRIDHRVDVLLPEEDPAAAWTRLAQLERTQQLLQREVETIDMRLPDRLVLRVATPPGKTAMPEKKTAPAGRNRT